MTIAVVAAVSLAALLGVSGLLVIGHRLNFWIRNGKFPILAVPVSIPFILINIVLAVYFAGMAGDAGAGGVDSAGRAGMYIWAVPAFAAALSALWFLILDIRTISRRGK